MIVNVRNEMFIDLEVGEMRWRESLIAGHGEAQRAGINNRTTPVDAFHAQNEVLALQPLLQVVDSLVLDVNVDLRIHFFRFFLPKFGRKLSP